MKKIDYVFIIPIFLLVLLYSVMAQEEDHKTQVKKLMEEQKLIEQDKCVANPFLNEVQIEKEGKPQSSLLILNRIKVENEVLTELNEKSEIPVIIDLKDNIKELKIGDVRRNIAKNQDSILSSLTLTGESPNFKLKRKYKVINSIAGNLTKEGLNKLKNNPLVEAVYIDRILNITLTESVPLVNADDVWQLSVNGSPVTGKGITVCVIDTGIDYTHPDLGGCFGPSCRVLGGYDWYNDDADPMDDTGHGTHVAGIVAANGSIKGIAPDAKLIAQKVCSAFGGCPSSDMIAGVDWCVNNAVTYNISIITMSMGDGGQYNEGNCPTWMDSSIDVAYTNDIFVSISSGNNAYLNGISYPACSPHAISVGAVYDENVGTQAWFSCTDLTTNTDQISCFTNRGDLLDLLAPGSVILSTKLGGGLVVMGGTSMATPMVAGAAALVRQFYPNLKPDQIRDLLYGHGKIISNINNSGLEYRRIDIFKSLTENCTVPTSNMYINEDTTLCEGIYHLSNGLRINASNVVLECNGATLMGSGASWSMGIYSSGWNNIVIKNCYIGNYEFGIWVTGYSQNINLSNNHIISLSSSGDPVGFFISGIDYGSLHLDTSNTVLGEPIHFYYNISNVVFKDLILNAPSVNTMGKITCYNCKNITITNNTLSNNWEWNLELTNSDYITITNNQILNNRHDWNLELSNSNNNYVYNNNITSKSTSSIHLYSSNNNQFLKNYLGDSYYSIYSWYSNNNSFRYNHLKNTQRGVYYRTPNEDNTFEYNFFENVSEYNIYNKQIHNVSAKNNWWGSNDESYIQSKIFDYYDNNAYGVVDYTHWLNKPCVLPKDGMVITEDTTFCPGEYFLPNGIMISSSNIELDCNGAILLGNKSGQGIASINDRNILIKSCNVYNYSNGAWLTQDVNITIEDSDFSFNERGIWLWQPQNLNLINSKLSHNQGEGVELYFSGSKDILMTNNNIFSNGIGVDITSSSFDGLTIKYNNIYNNTNYNIYNDNINDIYAKYNYWGTTNENEIKNKIYDYYDNPTKGIVLYQPWLDYPLINCTVPTDGMVITENTKFCKGTYYLYNGISIGADNVTLDCDGTILIGDNHGGEGITLIGKNAVKVTKCIIKKYEKGLWIRNSSSNIIQENNISDNYVGIASFENSSNNFFFDNQIYGNVWNGMSMDWYSSNNRAFNNSFYSNGYRGLEISSNSNGNTIYNNNIYLNGNHGIRLMSNVYTTIISNNKIYSNVASGIIFDHFVSNNDISNNKIFNNSGKGLILSRSSSNNTIFYNNISNNEEGISLYYDLYYELPLDNVIQYNNIFNNSQFNLNNNQLSNTTAKYNHWGTKNETLIQEKIYDCNDNSNRGCVDYDPWLCAPYPDETPSPCYDCGLRVYNGENISEEDFEEVKVWCDDFKDKFPQKGPMYPQSERVVLHYFDKCSYPELTDCCSDAGFKTIEYEWLHGLCNDTLWPYCFAQYYSRNCTSINTNCTSIILTENCTDGIDNDNDGFIDSEDQDCYQYRTINLTQGWNLVASPFEKGMDSTEALASIEGCYKGIFGFNQGVWNMLVPGNPFSNIDVIRPDKGYWINVNCTKAYWAISIN